MMECRMDGRIALITGGSRGLGRAMAETFLKAGAKVAIVARRPDVLQSFEAYIANIGKGIPIGRMGTAQEYANLACFLASDAGSYVTGTAINLDGGACPVV